jgi:hypothetical protein
MIVGAIGGATAVIALVAIIGVVALITMAVSADGRALRFYEGTDPDQDMASTQMSKAVERRTRENETDERVEK